jgi:ribose/xylose/arabinose/galactoside ABC-type transport system permease subunit
MTFSLLVEGIELSVGSVIALSGVVAASFIVQGQVITGILLGLLIGAACGFVNGLLIGFLRLPPVIATYGMLYIARGLALSYTGGFAIYGFGLNFRRIATGTILGIPVPILIAIGMAFFLNAAEPIIGELFALDAIAATVIGGTSFDGGEGGPRGTVIGALIISVLHNGLNLLRVSSQWQIFFVGAVILAAVTLDILAKRIAEAKM